MPKQNPDKYANEKQLLADLIRGASDISGRGVLAPLLGAAGDIAGLGENGLRALVGKPQVEPWGGSEHIGRKMQTAGLVSSERRPKTELLASLVSPGAVLKTALNAPKTAVNALRMLDNLDAPATMRNIGQRGAVDVGLSKLVAPQDEALRVAQQNAALPIEQGGLGLRVDNTPEERASAMGYIDPRTDEFYRGQHTAPMSDSGAPAHDLTGGGNVYPDDVYSSNAARYYGHGEPTDASLFSKLHSLRGKPDESVRIFRAVPTDVFNAEGHRFNHGDWITPNRAYAVEHGEGALNGDYKIIAGNVPAKAIFTNGDSPYEFGLDRTQYFADGPASLPVMHSKQYQTLDRSRFAAFDPKRRDSSDLLAGSAPIGLGALIAQPKEKKKKKQP